jgi:hypothetical protein
LEDFAFECLLGFGDFFAIESPVWFFPGAGLTLLVGLERLT